MNKTATAIAAFQEGDLKTALKLSSGFRMGVTREEQATLKRGYECIVHPGFYEKLGKVPATCIDAAKAVFVRAFLKEE